MKMRYVILMLFTLILAISTVSASENMTDLDDSHFDDVLYQNEASISLSENDSTVNDGADNSLSDNDSTSSDIANNSSDDSKSQEKINYILKGSDVQKFAFDKPYYTFKLTDDKGNPINNASVLLKLNGKNYYKTTNNQGRASLDLSHLNAGKYAIAVEYHNASITNNIKILSLKVTSNNIQTTYGTNVKYTVKLSDNFGNKVKNHKVTIKILGKKYHIKTDSKGVATLNLNRGSGKYIIKYYVDNLHGKNRYIVKNNVKLSVLKWGNKGDVSKIKLINNSMPNNVWVKKAVDATKKGIPLLKFSGGSGKVIFITAGVHGNELSSQVAAMKLIKYLTDTPIKGTVYVVPFVNIKAISHKVRYTDMDYNRVASKSGTISNKIVNLVVKYGCDYYGDFHTTQPGGIPGKDVVMGSKTPNLKSYKLTNFIVKKCNVNKIVYDYAGQKYPGAIADNVNNRGIPAVLCEVKLPHNTLTTRTVNLSLSMMKALLNFAKVI